MKDSDSSTEGRSKWSVSKPPPTQVSMCSCSSWSGSASTSRSSANPQVPPQSSGGHTPAPARHTGYSLPASCGRRALDLDVVVPAVPEVVLVREADPDRRDIGESRPPLILGRRTPILPVIDAVADPGDLELVEVVVLPPHRPLDDFV